MSDPLVEGTAAKPFREIPVWGDRIVEVHWREKADTDEPPVVIVQAEGLSPRTFAVAKLFAYGTITYTGQPAAADTITVNGHEIKFVAANTANPGPTEVKIAGSLKATLAAVAAKINAAPATYGVTASASKTVLTLTALLAGASTIAIAASGATVSGPTLMLPVSFVEADPYPAAFDVPLPLAAYAIAALFDPGQATVLNRDVLAYNIYNYLAHGTPTDFAITNIRQNTTRRSSIVNFKNAETATVTVFGRPPTAYAVLPFDVEGPVRVLVRQLVPIDNTVKVNAYPSDSVFTPKEDGSVETTATPIWTFEVMVSPTDETATTITFDKKGRVV